MLTIFGLSGSSQLAVPKLNYLFATDKIGHFLIFGLITTSLLRTPYLYKKKKFGVLLAIILTSCYGFFDEWRQAMTPGRNVEFADWVADTLGALIAGIAYYRLRIYRNLLEYQIRRKTKRSKH
jgi:VanZ family protein